LRQIANRTVESGGAILKKLDELERGLRSAGEQSGNTLAAYSGEIDDRLKRSSGLKVPAQTAKYPLEWLHKKALLAFEIEGASRGS